MSFKRPKRLYQGEEELDPIGGAVSNLLDLMLVFACGLLIALVLSWHLQDVFFREISPRERQKLIQAIQQAVQLEQGRELKETPLFQKGGGSGYQELGTVYIDPKTNKLIMIEKEAAE